MTDITYNRSEKDIYYAVLLHGRGPVFLQNAFAIPGIAIFKTEQAAIEEVQRRVKAREMDPPESFEIVTNRSLWRRRKEEAVTEKTQAPEAPKTEYTVLMRGKVSGGWSPVTLAFKDEMTSHFGSLDDAREAVALNNVAGIFAIVQVHSVLTVETQVIYTADVKQTTKLPED